MSISVSTIMYQPYHLSEVWQLLKKTENQQIGIELFPFHHLTYFEEVLRKNISQLKERDITVHCPYFSTDPAYKKGTLEYDVFVDYYKRTFAIAKELQAAYVVHHFYNAHFAPEEREDKKRISLENLEVYKELAKENELVLALENTETSQNPSENMFTQKEFIETVKKQKDCKVLIDIGHANCVHWDISKVIQQLQDRIVGYHLHNNDGVGDQHRPVRDGSLDFEQFAKVALTFTPDADYTLEYEYHFNNVEGVCRDLEYLKAIGIR